MLHSVGIITSRLSTEEKGRAGEISPSSRGWGVGWKEADLVQLPAGAGESWTPGGKAFLRGSRQNVYLS